MTERDCKECGESNWNQFYETERTTKRSGTTIEERFECCNCGKEGRKFTHDNSASPVWSGGMRE